MNCCENFYDLGCFDSCEGIVLPVNWLETSATLSIVSSFSGNASRWDFDVVQDQAIEIPNNFNESASSTFRVLDENGQAISFTIGTELYDCFRVKISPLTETICDVGCVDDNLD